jgi:hypothetical protein
MGQAVAEWAKVEEQDLPGRSKVPRLVEARDLLVLAALRFFFSPNQKVARFLHQTASASSRSHQRAQQQQKRQPERIHSLRDQLLRL